MDIKEIFLKLLNFSSRILKLEKKSVKSFELAKEIDSVKVSIKDVEDSEITSFQIKGNENTDIDVVDNKVCINTVFTEYTGSNGVTVNDKEISLDENVLVNSDINYW